MFYEFLTQMVRLPLMFFKRAMANPMGIFIYGIISKWYIMVMISVLVVTYWVFKGLEESGVLGKMEAEVRGGLMQAQAVAKYCVPKIVNLSEMWDCINNTPEYIPHNDEIMLREALERDRQDTADYHSGKKSSESNHSATNPYDEASDVDSSHYQNSAPTSSEAVSPYDTEATSEDTTNGVQVIN